MPDYPQLVYLSVPELVGAAGGDPWQIDDTIQAGAPGEISELATSFRAAGTCITETDEEFLQAKKRFEESWDRDDPAHPINDAEEVRRATQWLRLSREQMAKVSADLQNIAATLAEAQRSGHVSISGLNGRLVQIDNTIAAEIAQAQADGVNLDWSALKTAAIDTTKQSLNEMTAVRDAYGSKLDEAELDMAADGYDMDAVAGAEGEGDPSAQDQAGSAAEKYDQTQRAAASASTTTSMSAVRRPAAGRPGSRHGCAPTGQDPSRVPAAAGGGTPRYGADVTGCRHGVPGQLRNAGPHDGAQPRRAAAQKHGPVRTGRDDGDQGPGVTQRQHRHGRRAVRDLEGNRQARAGRAVQGGRGTLHEVGQQGRLGRQHRTAGHRGHRVSRQRLEPQRGTRQGDRRRLRQRPRRNGRRRGRRLVRRPVHRCGAAIIGGLLGGFAGSDIGGGIGANFDPQRVSPAAAAGGW